MITDPITLRAKPPGVITRHRVLRGGVVAASSMMSSAPVGHERDTEHPKGSKGFSENHGLRLSQTLSPTLGRGAP